jgi:hypothetical protein
MFCTLLEERAHKSLGEATLYIDPRVEGAKYNIPNNVAILMQESRFNHLSAIREDHEDLML